MNDLTKNLLLWVVVAVVLMVVFQSFSPKTSGAGAPGATYSQFLDQVDSGTVQKVTFAGDMRGGTNEITYTTRGGQTSTITAPFDRDLINVLRTKNVEIVQQEPSSGISLGAILMNFLPVILIIGFWLFIMRQMQGGGGGAKGAMSFGKSRAKLQGEDQVKVTFADVAGCDEAKEEVGELVDFLRDPSKFTKLGGKIPNARPSMLLDFQAGRRCEIDAINGSIPRLGRPLGVPTPVNDTVVGIVKARERSLLA